MSISETALFFAAAAEELCGNDEGKTFMVLLVATSIIAHKMEMPSEELHKCVDTVSPIARDLLHALNEAAK